LLFANAVELVSETCTRGFVLTAYGRINAGTVHGDRELGHEPRPASSGFEDGELMSIDLDAIAADRERIKSDFLQESPDRPESSARGLHHFALICSDVRRTVEFYQGVLEFPLTEIFENRDYQGSNHFFFDIGHGNLLAFFDLPGLDLGPYAEVLGGLHHLAISVTREKWDHLRGKLDAAGVEYLVESEASIYFRDPDGARLELLADPLGEMYGTKVL
jgi:catechol 2,3-dioxygenase-like lactoylglutathione lyase family enzyme